MIVRPGCRRASSHVSPGCTSPYLPDSGLVRPPGTCGGATENRRPRDVSAPVRNDVGVSTLLERRRLFALVVAAQLADLVTFMAAISNVGIHAEQNPVARGLFDSLGSAGPAAYKVGAVGVIVLVLWRIAVRFPGYAGRSAALAVALGALGAWSNVAFGLVR